LSHLEKFCKTRFFPNYRSRFPPLLQPRFPPVLKTLTQWHSLAGPRRRVKPCLFNVPPDFKSPSQKNAREAPIQFYFLWVWTFSFFVASNLGFFFCVFFFFSGVDKKYPPGVMLTRPLPQNAVRSTVQLRGDPNVFPGCQLHFLRTVFSNPDGCCLWRGASSAIFFGRFGPPDDSKFKIAAALERSPEMRWMTAPPSWLEFRGDFTGRR